MFTWMLTAVLAAQVRPVRETHCDSPLVRILLSRAAAKLALTREAFVQETDGRVKQRVSCDTVERRCSARRRLWVRMKIVQGVERWRSKMQGRGALLNRVECELTMASLK